MNPATIALIVSALILVFGGGTLFKSWQKNAVMEFQLSDTAKKVDEHTRELASLKSGLALTDQKMEQIHNSLRKLDLLETVTSQMNQLMERTSNILPRPEADLRFSELGRRVHDVEETVKEITHNS